MHNTRQEWTTYENIPTMYELVYEQMVEANIAVRLPEEEQYWVDVTGNIVDSEDDAAGHKCTIKLTNPEWLLFGDEVGTELAQDGDGHIGGQTYLTFGGQKVELTSSKASGRFTVMGLTAATGDPVMCIFIFAGKELGIKEVLGYDYQSEIPYNVDSTLEKRILVQGRRLQVFQHVTFAGKRFLH